MIKAKEAGLSLLAMEQIKEIDLYVDGADEITADLTLLKGRGYDLVKEKLLARSAKRFIVIADESKIVKNIGDNFPIPSEVHPFAWELIKNVLIKKVQVILELMQLKMVTQLLRVVILCLILITLKRILKN